MATQRELLDAYNNLSSKLVRNTGAVVGSIFSNLGSWRDEDFERFLKLIDGTLVGAKLQSARLQVAFYGEMAKLNGSQFTTAAITSDSVTTAALRNGVTTEVVYRRPFVEVYTALSQGKSLTQAIEAGVLRVSSIASTDIQLSRRNAGLQVRGKNQGIVGYARTLTGSENCALCYVASTQRYRKNDLMPIHPGCDCGEMPIYGNQDPGQIIDEIRLEAVHEAIDDRFGQSNRSAEDYNEIAIREHGELGPLLTVRDQHFTGPSDL